MNSVNSNHTHPVREVDTNAFLDAMRELVEEGRLVSVTVAGNSMSPFLADKRDRVFFQKPARPLKKGDIVFYQRTDSRYIMHRIYKIKQDKYYMTGDAQTEIEGPLKKEQIFALVTQCERKGKQIKPGDFWWDFFEKVWIRVVPLRPVIRRIYSKINHLWHSFSFFI